MDITPKTPISKLVDMNADGHEPEVQGHRRLSNPIVDERAEVEGHRRLSNPIVEEPAEEVEGHRFNARNPVTTEPEKSEPESRNRSAGVRSGGDAGAEDRGDSDRSKFQAR